MTTDPERPVVPEELAELRRSLDVGLARVDGQLALLTQRDVQHTKDQDDLSVRIAALEHTRWPLPALAALTAVGALAVAVWQAIGH
ncbi:hypothetical protein AB0I84_15225 [Streptomyces spectabilis]|uniref:Uncharacterized protein n=1 Tax=Streptomyces spectabilis TaxID=68270 RepID=A0A5P2X6Z1_STRST|nr:hypothetical protein [Streptomyces spectabilis]MBB5105895.1 hypothetical protein [Streptomyces spectabilis]MCI3901428.1 hypothetical protein [Streptomyces spectabilis]QEV58895.1 hypothetical protein CP982_09290 [Streptomyces spectabilis]GGV24767.1 hypothetical protein GCM10010245_41050 [Streptomyces spectabilis]